MMEVIVYNLKKTEWHVNYRNENSVREYFQVGIYKYPVLAEPCSSAGYSRCHFILVINVYLNMKQNKIFLINLFSKRYLI